MKHLKTFESFLTESYKRPSPTTKISGEFEITIDSKVVKTRVAGFERENDDSDALYFMDGDELRDTIGSLIVKNNVMTKLSKGEVVTAVSSKGGKKLKIKRTGDL
jgi:hypothetical protein